jgi:hypothetical protein
MDDLDLAKKLVDALVDDGAVYATGGMVWSKTKGNLMSTTDMIEAIRLCNVAGIRVERTDGGGFPTWKMFRELRVETLGGGMSVRF